MTPGPVVVDRVVLPAAAAPRWTERCRAEYEPGVIARGGPAAVVHWTAGDRPGTVTVVCEWHLPDLGAFWRARAASADSAVLAWWAETDRLALHRERRVLAPLPMPVAPVAPVSPVTPDAPTTGVRAVVVGRPVGDPATAVAGLGALAGALPGLRASAAGLHLPGVVAPDGLGADAATWDLVLDRADRLDAVLADERVRALVTPGTAVRLEPVASRAVAESAHVVVKRTLLLSVRPDADPAAVAGLEADLAAMPAHIPAIRSWSLARVTGGDPIGGRPWTHVWEQEFADVTGLTSDYMTHPFHWAVVDAWFDAEVPGHVVAPTLAHLSCTRPPSLAALLDPDLPDDGSRA